MNEWRGHVIVWSSPVWQTRGWHVHEILIMCSDHGGRGCRGSPATLSSEARKPNTSCWHFLPMSLDARPSTRKKCLQSDLDLNRLHLETNAYLNAMEPMDYVGRPTGSGEIGKIIEIAVGRVQERREQEVVSADLFAAILQYPQCNAATILRNAGIELERLKTLIEPQTLANFIIHRPTPKEPRPHARCSTSQWKIYRSRRQRRLRQKHAIAIAPRCPRRRTGWMWSPCAIPARTRSASRSGPSCSIRTTPRWPCAAKCSRHGRPAQMMAEMILPALAADKVVVCDRFVSSTLAYQSAAKV